jgi:hypothetical protein
MKSAIASAFIAAYVFRLRLLALRRASDSDQVPADTPCPRRHACSRRGSSSSDAGLIHHRLRDRAVAAHISTSIGTSFRTPTFGGGVNINKGATKFVTSTGESDCASNRTAGTRVTEVEGIDASRGFQSRTETAQSAAPGPGLQPPKRRNRGQHLLRASYPLLAVAQTCDRRKPTPPLHRLYTC